MLTVAQLIKKLQEQDPNRTVIMARDAEGNDYSPLYTVYPAAYRPITTYNGYVGLEELTEEFEKHGWTEEDVVTDGEPALILVPVN